MSDRNLSIRGYFVTCTKLDDKDSATFYQELEELMEEEYIDYGYLTYKPFAVRTIDPHNNDAAIDLRIVGVLGSLKPADEDLRIRNEIADFMEKWKMESMYFCWSRLKFEPSFGKNTFESGLDDIKVVGDNDGE